MADEKQLFELSAELGTLLQKSGCSPVEACCALLVTAGRLMAREAFEDLETEGAWHKGRPR